MNAPSTSHGGTGIAPDASAAAIVAAIAACANGVRPATLVHALGIGAASLRAATDTLEAAGDVVFLSGRLHMQSEQLRDAALAPLGHAERAELHGALAEAIGRTSYEPGVAELERALHEVHAGRADVAAGRLERVARGALRAADGRLAMRALDARCGIDDAEPVSPAVLELRARAGVEVGDPRSAELWRAAVEACAGEGDPAGAARAIVGRFWAATDDAGARAALGQLATGAGPGATASGWRSYAGGVLEVMSGRWSDAIEPLERSLAEARDHEDPALEVAVLGTLATVRSYLGQLGLAAELLRRCLPLAYTEGDAVAARRIRHNLVEVLLESLQTSEAIDEAARGAVDALHRGAAAWAPGAIALHARALAAGGRMDEARAEAERSLALNHALEPNQRDIYVDLVAADLLALEGLSPRCIAFLGSTEAKAREFGFDSYLEAIAEVRMRAAAFSGDVDATLAATPSLDGIEPVTAATLGLAAARLLVEHPHRADLTRSCEALIEAVGAQGATIPLADLCIREARAVLDDAGDELTDIAAMWEEAERPIDALLARRASLLRAQAGDGAAGIEHDRVTAGLEAAGLIALVKRIAGADETVRSGGLQDQLEPGAPARVHPTQSPMLEELPAGERSLVLAELHEHVLEPGDVSPLPRGVCFVSSGEVRLHRVEPETTDRRLVVAALGPGDIFGHESLLPAADAGSSGLRIEAASSSVIWVLPAARLAAVISLAPRFGTALLADATARLGEARLLAGESALLPVETRLARTLVRLGERFGRPSLRGDLLLDTSLTHADLASMIGSQRARVSGLMSALQKQGVLDSWKRRILVLDLAELRLRSGADAVAGTAAAGSD